MSLYKIFAIILIASCTKKVKLEYKDQPGAGPGGSSHSDGSSQTLLLSDNEALTLFNDKIPAFISDGNTAPLVQVVERWKNKPNEWMSASSQGDVVKYMMAELIQTKRKSKYDAPSEFSLAVKTSSERYKR